VDLLHSLSGLKLLELCLFFPRSVCSIWVELDLLAVVGV
jgi:hypothetical protein